MNKLKLKPDFADANRKIADAALFTLTALIIPVGIWICLLCTTGEVAAFMGAK